MGKSMEYLMENLKEQLKEQLGIMSLQAEKSGHSIFLTWNRSNRSLLTAVIVPNYSSRNN